MDLDFEVFGTDRVGLVRFLAPEIPIARNGVFKGVLTSVFDCSELISPGDKLTGAVLENCQSRVDDLKIFGDRNFTWSRHAMVHLSVWSFQSPFLRYVRRSMTEEELLVI